MTSAVSAGVKGARPQGPVLLAVDQALGEGAALRIAPELADPVGPLEIGQHEDVEQFGAWSGPNASRRARRRRSSSSGLMAARLRSRTVGPRVGGPLPRYISEDPRMRALPSRCCSTLGCRWIEQAGRVQVGS
jgi:hypothetical protein